MTQAQANALKAAIAALAATFLAGVYLLVDNLVEPDLPPPPPPPVDYTPAPLPATVQTSHDTIPVLGKDFTAWSTQDGADTWNKPPTAADVLVIDHAVDLTQAIEARAVTIRGKFVLKAALTVRDLLVLPGGSLEMEPGGKIIFANQPLDLTADPGQWGNGLVVLGKFHARGTLKTPFVRLTTEPKAGDLTLTLATAPVGWLPGDKLVLPDSRELRNAERKPNYVPQWETPLIQSVSDNVVTLTAPLAFNHPGMRNPDGVLEFLPHVGNLTRDCVIKSQSALGTRGHVLFSDRADVDVRYCQFGGLGRTKNDPIGPSNLEGRYPVHFHHLYGPSGLPAEQPQYVFEGNSVFCPIDPMPFKWAIVIHDAHYGRIADNVVYNWAGWGIGTEDGSETENVIENNFVCRIFGTGSRDHMGREGSGIWLRGPKNRVRNNVITNVSGTGAYSFPVEYYFSGTGNRNLPKFKGANTTTDYVRTDLNGVSILEDDGQEVYGACDNAITYWWVNTKGDLPQGTGGSTIKNFKAWGIWNWCLFAYESSRMTLDGWKLRGSGLPDAPKGLVFNDYSSPNLFIKNADLQGLAVGWGPSHHSGRIGYVGPQTMENCRLRNLINIQVGTPWTSSYKANNIPPRTVNVRNCSLEALPGKPPQHVVMVYPPPHSLASAVLNLVVKDELFLYGHNGEDLQVYYSEQRGDFILPQSVLNADGTARLLASPSAGKTNAQNWIDHNVALAGSVAPADATTRAGIQGLVKVK